jgi:hypothetical protein
MEITCPKCQAKLQARVTPQTAGQTVRCPKCYTEFPLPLVAAAAPAAPPPVLTPASGAKPAVAKPAVAKPAGAKPAGAKPAGALPPRPQPTPLLPGPRPSAAPAPAAGSAGSTQKLAAGAFAAALLCFLLPFFHISCMGNKIVTIKGITLVTGGKAEIASDMNSMMKGATEMPGVEMKAGPSGGEKDIPSEPLALGAAIACAAGLALSLLKGKPGALAGTLAAVGGIVLLLVLLSKVNADVQKDASKEKGGGPVATAKADDPMAAAMGKSLEQSMEGMIKVEAAMGFMLTVILLAIAAALDIVAVVQLKKAAASAPGAA